MNTNGREYPVTLGDQTELRQPFYFPLRFLEAEYSLASASVLNGKEEDWPRKYLVRPLAATKKAEPQICANSRKLNRKKTKEI